MLSTDQGIEQELIRLAPSDVAFHFTRMPSYVDCLERNTSHAKELSETANGLYPCANLDAAIYGCSSGEITFGASALRETIHTILPDIPVITPISASISALREISADVVSILSVYDRELNIKLTHKFAKAGIRTERIYELSLNADFETALLTEQFFADAITQIRSDKPKCLFVPCNSVSVVSHIQMMENYLNVPVITSTQAVFWQAMNSIGHDKLKLNSEYESLFQTEQGVE